MKKAFLDSEEYRTFSEERFVNPPLKNYPIYTWTLNSELTKQEIATQLTDMKNDGIRFVYCVATSKRFRPQMMHTTLSPDYIEDEYVELICYAARFCYENGMLFWLYDEDGWPSGSASGEVVIEDPSLVQKGFVKKEIELEKGKEYDFSGYLTANNEMGEKLPKRFVSQKKEKVTVYAIEEIHARSLPYPDVLSKKATQSFIRHTHERYKSKLGEDFSKIITATFTDEPNLPQLPYTEGLFEMFYKKYGYRLEERIAQLFDEDKQGAQVRIDYRSLVATLFSENYFGTLREWCDKNGIVFTGHTDGDHDIRCHHQNGHIMRDLRKLEIPGIDAILRQIFPCQRYVCEENKSLNQGENGFYPRVCASVASQTGQRFALTESFAVNGSGITFDQMRYVLGHQAVRGINLFNIMNMTSGDKQGHNTSLRPNFVKHCPEREYLASFNRQMARASYLGSLGRRSVDVALYFPICDVWSNAGSMSCATSYEKMGFELEKNGVDFDIVDDDAILASVKSDSITVGNAKYTTLCIAENRYMPKQVKERLDSLEKNGLKICRNVDEIPAIGELETLSGTPFLTTKRELDDGTRVYILYNGMLEKRQSRLKINTESHASMLKINQGEIEEIEKELDLALESGELAYIMISEKKTSRKQHKNEKKNRLFGIKTFEVRAEKEFSVRGSVKSSKSEKTPKIVDVCKEPNPYGEYFSGSLVYKATLGLPKNDSEYALDVSTPYPCRVSINGKTIGERLFSPHNFTFDSSILSGDSNTLEIYISTTSAGANLSATEIITDRSTYHDTQLAFEKEALNYKTLGDEVVVSEIKSIED